MENLAKALTGFQAEVGAIYKSSEAQFGRYADLATVISAISPALSKNGLAVSQSFSPWADGGTVLRTTLFHSSGDAISSDVVMPDTSAHKNPLQAFGAATTYLRRYSLLALLNLATEDDDGDGFAHRGLSQTGTGADPRPVAQAPGAPAARKIEVIPARPAKLLPEDRRRLIEEVKALGSERIGSLQIDFRKHFDLAPDVSISDYIKLQKHADFIREWIANAVNQVLGVPS